MGPRPRFVETTRDAGRKAPAASPSEPSLVLVHHPALSKVGQTIALDGRVTEVSRLAPSLVDAAGGDAGPLDDPYVSRRPVALRRLAGGAIAIENVGGVDISVGGAALGAGCVRRVPAGEVERGVDLTLADRVVLWLTSDYEPRGENDLGMFGRSSAAHALRAAVREAALSPGPVLVRGETGAGKELVARALHAAGPRSSRPFVAVNVAAIPAAVAASELFGHERGAFTGADERRAGYFERAEGGVLFLDEIGELPEAVQPMLLRAVEQGEVQPLGGRPRRVDATVVAATDADLGAAVRAGKFRGPLYFRLASRVIDVPPLRVRGVDVALLLAQFFAEALPDELADQTTFAQLRLPASLFSELLRRPWPGNIRQLRAAAVRLADAARAGRIAGLGDLDLAPPAPPAGEGDGPPAPRDIDQDRLLAALRSNRFQLNRTAEALGVSRTHLDALIERSPKVRKAKDLAYGEIAACLEALGGDVDAAASKLEVSPRGLRLRMRQLGL